jgi:hypothetical protein
MSGLLGKRKSFPRWDSNPVPSEPYSRHCIDKGGVVQKKKKKKNVQIYFLNSGQITPILC